MTDYRAIATESARREFAVSPGRFDQGERKQSQRRGRERGCWVYISAEQLAQCGIDPRDDPPQYRIWAATSRPRVVASLYPHTA